MKTIRKLFVFLTLLMLLGVMTVEANAWGSSFEESTGTLTVLDVDGPGKIPNFASPEQTPWYEYRHDIRHIVLDGIDSVGSYAFADCTSLESLTLEGRSCTIGDYAFYGCTKLSNVYLFGETLGTSAIGKCAFQFCSSLKELSLPARTTIGSKAFADCTELSDIYFSEFSRGTLSGLSIADTAFEDVIAAVHYTKGVGLYGKDQNYGGTLSWTESDYGLCGAGVRWRFQNETLILEASENDETHETGNPSKYADGQDTPWYPLEKDIKKIEVYGVEKIPAYLFEYLTNVETVSLPDSLTTLACNAFNDCSRLNHVVIPPNVVQFERFGAYVGQFNRCTALTDIWYLGTENEWSKIENSGGILPQGSKAKIHFLTRREKNPTCTESGYAAYYTFEGTSNATIYSSDKTVIDAPIILPAKGHMEVTDNAVERTCTSNGLTEGKHCSVCGSVLVAQSTIPSLGHNLIRHVEKAVSCTEVGWKEYYDCTRCEYTTYEEIAALGHTEVVDTAVQPTCTATGLTEGTHCSMCGEVLVKQSIVSALGHDLVHHDGKAATCTETGWKDYDTCTRCEYTTYEEIAALGHTEVVDTAVQSTCTATGLTEGTHCSVCGEVLAKQESVPALGHDLVHHDGKAASCTEAGWKEYYDCTRCEYMTYEEIAALGHTEVIDTAAQPTCMATGLTEGKHCSVCGEVLAKQESVPALGHDLVHHDGKAASCTEAGWKEYYDCTRCEYTTYEEIAALGHTEVIDAAVIPTVGRNGLTEGTHCAVCRQVLLPQETIETFVYSAVYQDKTLTLSVKEQVPLPLMAAYQGGKMAHVYVPTWKDGAYEISVEAENNALYQWRVFFIGADFAPKTWSYLLNLEHS